MSRLAPSAYEEDKHRPLRRVDTPFTLAEADFAQIFALIVGHSIMVAVVRQSAVLATIHAGIVFLLAFYFLVRDTTPERLVYAMAYIAGFDLIWRGARALIFWESAKYVLITLSILSVIRYQRVGKSDKLPFLYSLLLLPSIYVLPYFDRRDISFNVSGGIALGIITFFFSSIKLTQAQLKQALFFLLLPIIGLGVLAASGILAAGELQFVVGAKTNSAGIGPNQVSSMFGAGMFAALFYAIIESRVRAIKVLMVFCSVWLGLQAALTTSRGGFYTGLIAIFVAGLYMLRSPRARGLFIGGGLVTVVMTYFVIIPTIDNMTNGRFTARLQDTGLTGRDRIIESDLIAFREFPVFGLGPGQSYEFHALTFRPSAPHTEYSRLLAEHGSFGLVALLILFGTSIGRGLRKRPSVVAQGFVVSATLWVLLYMIHSAMRLAVPAFLFGLVAAEFILDNDEEEAPAPPPFSQKDVHSRRNRRATLPA